MKLNIKRLLSSALSLSLLLTSLVPINTFAATKKTVKKPALNFTLKSDFYVNSPIKIEASISNPDSTLVKYGYVVTDAKKRKIVSYEEKQLHKGNVVFRHQFTIKNAGTYTIQVYAKNKYNKYYLTSTKNFTVKTKPVIQNIGLNEVSVNINRFLSGQNNIELKATKLNNNTFFIDLSNENKVTSLVKINLKTSNTGTFKIAFEDNIIEYVKITINNTKIKTINFPMDIFGFDNPPAGASINSMLDGFGQNTIKLTFINEKNSQEVYHLIIKLTNEEL